MSLVAVVKRANRPGAPEHSVPLRFAATATVVVAIAACWSQGELTSGFALASMVLTVVGNVFSYRHRERPAPWLKVVLAAVVLGAFAWFFVTVTSHTAAASLTHVLVPLATLFTGIQVTHAFDVPSRRDLAFSLAGSATLMAVAAAQAVDSAFGLYVVAWAALGLVGLRAAWASMAGGARTTVAATTTAGVAVVVVGVVLVALLPPPHAASNLLFPVSLGGGVPLGPSGALVGGGPNGSQPVRAGSPSGPDRTGGYLGFAGPLDTAIRGPLGDQVVMRVRADRPSYWIAETFDHWNGTSWTATTSHHQLPWRTLRPTAGSSFSVPPPAGDLGQGPLDVQTFYLAVPGPNLVFHAADAVEVWAPSDRLFVSPDGTIRAGSSMGRGTVYTVESAVDRATPAELRTVSTKEARATGAADRRYLQLPHPYPAVRALAERVTAHDHTLYQVVRSLEAWIAAHTRYSTDIPPLRPGQDSVTEFLFGNRRGYCEQISTSLAVMLRSLGLPARESTGYVPGSFDPITDLYQVQAKDAHAWVQVWFPHYGWQSFDPTAEVPLANPSPGSALAHDVAGVVHRVPLLPVGAGAAVALVVALVWRRRRARPTWTAAICADVEAAARRAGLDPHPGETILALATRLDQGWSARAGAAPPGAVPTGAPPGAVPTGAPPGAVPTAVGIVLGAQEAAFGGREPDLATRRRLKRSARRLRRSARGLRRTTPSGAAPSITDAREPAPRPSSPRQPARAGTTSGPWRD